jgi:hypothetical protein
MRAFALAFSLLLLSAAAVRAESNTLLRFYYSPNAMGTISKSPADPNGDKKSEAVDSTWKGDLELILWRRLGLSASRQNVLRDFDNAAGQAVHEEWVQYSYNLALYLREVNHYKFNLYAGGGTGVVEKYRYSFDKVRQNTRARDQNMPLSRAFGGIDYTFERIGFRYEYSVVDVEKDTAGFKDKLDQTYQHIGFFIPFN